ncbi:SusC/RagA family TonB-linked outer membrane protein [Sinomicrobium sp. M5D2P17]
MKIITLAGFSCWCPMTIAFILLSLPLPFWASPSSPFTVQQRVTGTVTDETGLPLPGVNIIIKDKGAGTMSDENGEYSITASPQDTLVYSFVGFKTRKERVGERDVIDVVMEENIATLEGVTVVSTGYQETPKERATGSFVFIDSTLLQRSVSTSILERLDGVTGSLIFNKSGGFNTPDISIRGRSTILGNPDPLVVVDNFPYNGDISTLNPNDVESITILKDAAAASIWGTRAGNGVIVIKTKSGKFNQKPQINFTSNITIGQKPRLYTQRGMTSAEYIEVETDMFERGRYNATIDNGYTALSPAVEILLMHRNGEIDLNTRNAMLNALAQYDSRDDLLKYFYQVPINRQYNLNISGGSETQKFFLSAGYDRNTLQRVGSSFERFTLNGQNTYNLFNNKLQWVSGMQFTTDKNESAPALPARLQQFPYLNLAEENGNALPFARDLRFSYIEAQEGNGLLDWYYRPLDERAPSRFSNSQNFRLQNNLTFRIAKPLSLVAFHSYQKGVTTTDTRNYEDSYYTRNIINSILSIDPETGFVTRPIYEGEILENSRSTLTSHYGRLQLAFDEIYGEHAINAIAGAEISEYKLDNASYTLYGYNRETGSNANAAIDFSRQYPRYTGAGSYQVPTGIYNSIQIDRNVSYYANTSYTYQQKYTLTASARKDMSNIFGVKSNQKGVPLWSIGGLWHIAKEGFYQIHWLPQLSLRATYGYNGNVDKSTSAYFTQRLTYNNLYGLPQYQVANPPNPSLRWEKVSNINIGLDFSTHNDRISGTIEYYHKHGQDLIGISPIAPQTGITDFRGNSANLKTKGIDVILNTKNLIGQIQWNTTILFNYVKDKVTHYEAEPGNNSSVILGTASQTPLVGYPYNAIFSYPWAGLDEAGNPQGYLNGEVSTDYTAIANSTDRNEIIHNGSRTPTYFGSLRNTFNFKNLQLSFLISYKGGYVFRQRNSLNSTNLYGTSGPTYTSTTDYGKRWQQPGDEFKTNVPALVYPANSRRENIYNYSDILVFRGDHIRLQDIRLSYMLDESIFKASFVRQVSLFCNANNLGVLWKRNNRGFDPDNLDIAQTRNISLGLTAYF